MPFKVYGDEKILPPKIVEITGEVSQIDSVGGVLILKTIDAQGVPQEMRFYIHDNGKDTAEDAHLIDLNVSDWVTLRYYATPSGNNIIVKLTEDNVIKKLL